MKKNSLFYIVGTVVFACFMFSFSCTTSRHNQLPVPGAGNNDTGLTLPKGFSAAIVADNLGRVRHIAVTKEGDIYAKLGVQKMEKGFSF